MSAEYTTALAYLVSILGGGVLAQAWLALLRWHIGVKKPVPAKWLLDWSLGTIERSIATTLVIWAPPLLPGFIGGWVALKLAANWQRRVVKDGEPDAQIELARNSLAALVGSAISLSVAIVAGVFVNREAAVVWTQ